MAASNTATKASDKDSLLETVKQVLDAHSTSAEKWKEFTLTKEDGTNATLKPQHMVEEIAKAVAGKPNQLPKAESMKLRSAAQKEQALLETIVEGLMPGTKTPKQEKSVDTGRGR